MLFTSTDPKDDLIGIIKAKNPAVTQPTEAFNVLSVRSLTGSPNTAVMLSVSAEYGAQGRFEVTFDRTDLSELYNKFPSGNRMPMFRMFGNPGDVITFSNIIDQVNQLLGTNLKMTGQLQDLVDKQFVLPAKDSHINVEILASDKSVRLVPGTKLELLIVANGAVLTSAFVNRSLNPIVNASGKIAYNDLSIDPAVPKELPSFKLMYMDFTAININNGGMLTAVAGARASDGTFVYYDIYLKQSVFDTVNAKLVAGGLPPLKNRRVAADIVVYSSNPVDPCSRIPKSVNDPSLANLSIINRNFTHVIPVPIVYGGQTEGPTSYATDYYLHYNV